MLLVGAAGLDAAQDLELLRDASASTADKAQRLRRVAELDALCGSVPGAGSGGRDAGHLRKALDRYFAKLATSEGLQAVAGVLSEAEARLQSGLEGYKLKRKAVEYQLVLLRQRADNASSEAEQAKSRASELSRDVKASSVAFLELAASQQEAVRLRALLDEESRARAKAEALRGDVARLEAALESGRTVEVGLRGELALVRQRERAGLEREAQLQAEVLRLSKEAELKTFSRQVVRLRDSATQTRPLMFSAVPPLHKLSRHEPAVALGGAPHRPSSATARQQQCRLEHSEERRQPPPQRQQQQQERQQDSHQDPHQGQQQPKHTRSHVAHVDVEPKKGYIGARPSTAPARRREARGADTDDTVARFTQMLKTAVADLEVEERQRAREKQRRKRPHSAQVRSRPATAQPSMRAPGEPQVDTEGRCEREEPERTWFPGQGRPRSALQRLAVPALERGSKFYASGFKKIDLGGSPP
jgi:hypothetical protein